MRRAGILWLLCACILSAIASVLFNRYTVLYTPDWHWSLLFLSILFTALLFVYRKKKEPAALIQTIIAAFVLRFLAGLIFLLLFSIFRKESFMHLSLHFIAHWFLLTGAEIAYLSQSFRKSKNK